MSMKSAFIDDLTEDEHKTCNMLNLDASIADQENNTLF